MANTHIIIPIKDIDNLLYKIQQAVYLPHEEDMLISKKFTKQYLLDKNHCKQISLDEKDIEIKANAAFDDSYALKETRVQAYKQALKDLL